MSADGFHHTTYAKTLRNQKGRAELAASEHLCPYPDHRGRVFQSFGQLYDGKAEHSADFDGLDPQQARAKFRMLAAELK